MDTNKGIKILRIVSLTLGILSMLLLLYTKIAHAEGNTVIEWDNTTDSMPLPFGDEYYGNLSFSAEEYLAQRNSITTIDFNEPYITFYKYSNENSYYLVWVQYQDAEHMLNIKSGTWGGNLSSITLENYGVVKVVTTYYDRQRNTAGFLGGSENNSSRGVKDIVFSDFGTVNNGKYTLNKNSTKYYYPIGSNVQEIGNLSHVFFSTGLTEEEVGQITDVFTETQIIADSGTDTIDTLTQATARNWFQAIINTIWNTANNLVSNFRSFFAPYFNNVTGKLGDIKDFFQTLLEKVTAIVEILQEYVANDLTANGIAQVWQTNFQASYVYTLITTGNSIKTALSSLGDTNATEPVITVNLGNNTFFGQTGEYIFRFGWYENIRTGVVTFITAFWLVGLGIHLFTQIPNMIHGVSGTAHGIQNAGETAIHKQ